MVCYLFVFQIILFTLVKLTMVEFLESFVNRKQQIKEEIQRLFSSTDYCVHEDFELGCEKPRNPRKMRKL